MRAALVWWASVFIIVFPHSLGQLDQSGIVTVILRVLFHRRRALRQVHPDPRLNRIKETGQPALDGVANCRAAPAILRMA